MSQRTGLRCRPASASASRWQPEIHKGFKKQGKHTAVADIHESIEELKYYRVHFLKGSTGA